jgi:hypothetical protein
MARQAASILILLLGAARLPAADSASYALEITQRVNARGRGQDSRMLLRMTIHDPRRGQFQKVV